MKVKIYTSVIILSVRIPTLNEINFIRFYSEIIANGIVIVFKFTNFELRL